MAKYRKQVTLTGVNGHKIYLTEMNDKKTAVEIEKMISFLPFNIEQTIDFLIKIGVTK